MDENQHKELLISIDGVAESLSKIADAILSVSVSLDYLVKEKK